MKKIKTQADIRRQAEIFTDEIYEKEFDKKEVDYDYDWENAVDRLMSGKFMWVDFEIVFYKWRHPCAYIRIPEWCNALIWVLKFDDYNNLPCPTVHWWFTYGDYMDKDNFRWFEEGWWAGWDYGHCEDYVSYWKDSPMAEKTKKWTTKEILVDVIEQILEWHDKWFIY